MKRISIERYQALYRLADKLTAEVFGKTKDSDDKMLYAYRLGILRGLRAIESEEAFEAILIENEELSKELTERMQDDLIRDED